MFLTDAEIDEICCPLTQPAAQQRFLRSLDLTVNEKPNGRPLVVRSHAEAVLSGMPATRLPGTREPMQGNKTGVLAMWGGAPLGQEPNVQGMLEHLAKRKGYRKKAAGG